MIIQADARAIPLADGCCQMCVTSPPYWNLRHYDVQGNQIGQEATPEEWVASLVSVFREVKRVLRSDGVLFVNVGDSYAQTGGRGASQGVNSQRKGRSNVAAQAKLKSQTPPPGCKPKDMIGLPWMLAFALRADGWYLRCDIIFSKRNPMPESIRDRPTKSHEYLFLLAKSERYFYQADAIREPILHPRESKPSDAARAFNRRRSTTIVERQDKIPAGWHQGTRADGSAPRDRRHARSSEDFRGGEKRNRDAERNGTTRGKTNQSCTHPNGKNKRSVWTLSTLAYAGKHFATFPPALVEPCILAGSMVGDIVIDPFAGANTTGLVAERLGRRWIALDIGYQDLQVKRVANVQKEIQF